MIFTFLNTKTHHLSTYYLSPPHLLILVTNHPDIIERMSSSRAKILLLGDSLTQTSFEGWGGGLANAYQRRADILNRGMSGYNTRWFLQYARDYDVWREPGDIKLVVIFFGANDASLEHENPHAHCPLDEYCSNLQQMVNLTKESYPYSKILLITPPPVHHEQRLEFQKQRYGEKATGVLERTLENTGKYAEGCRRVGLDNTIPVVDLYSSMQLVDDFGRYFTDGLHFSEEGHKFVELQVLLTIQEDLPILEVVPDPITKQFNNSGSKCTGIVSSGPYHDKIVHSNWMAAFEQTSGSKPSPEGEPSLKKPKVADEES
jgi:isoamyl acetate esterase